MKNQKPQENNPEATPALAATAGSAIPADPGTPFETQSAIADIWLNQEKNDAWKIMHAFKLGVKEGRRQAQYAEHHSTVEGTLAAFKEIMRLLPDSPNSERSDRRE